MPIYEYHCRNGCRVEYVRKYEDRDRPTLCMAHGLPMERILSGHHAQPDGIYSYEPNIGSADDYERKQDLMRRRKENGPEET